jgi:hypothetical protein
LFFIIHQNRCPESRASEGPTAIGFDPDRIIIVFRRSFGTRAPSEAILFRAGRERPRMRPVKREGRRT